jgi:hypothetical protein
LHKLYTLDDGRNGSFLSYLRGWSGTQSTITAAISWLIIPALDDGDDCGVISGTNEWLGNRNTGRKPSPVPLCPPQIPHELTWDRTRSLRGGKPATDRLSYGTAANGP